MRAAGRAFVTAFLISLTLFLVGLAVMLVGYVYVALRLPPPEELSSRSATFVSTKIYDRNGEVLFEVFDPHGGRRTLVPIEEISPWLIQATIATEDANFYHHPGVDPVGLARAVVKALQAGEIRGGGSTIPQQLVKLVFLSPEQTISRKIKEAVLASEITRRYSKDQILEIYLNEIFYGNLAYGVEAAAETYFGKPASDLTLAEAALLAGIPQSPAIYDPFTNPEDVRWRRSQVLRLMAENGFISEAEANAADAEPLPKSMQPFDIRAPHFVVYVRQKLEERYGPEVLYRAGLEVYTSLDYSYQQLAERAVRDHVLALADRHVTNGALVALRPSTGEILAMVGSRGFYDPDIDGQVNVTLQPRQPGSSIKPLTYLKAFEKGWTPATLIWDIETEFPDGANPPYRPSNYDGEFHGPTLVRQALGNSYNIPAVKTLEFVGLPDFLDLAQRMGITTLTRPDYGLSLTLGGGEVTLLELTSAYGTLANAGVSVPPMAILRVEDQSGRVLEEAQVPAEQQQVVSPQHAYLITDILADNDARQPSFGPNNVLRLSRPAAAKTGTTNDFRDNWTIGYTPELAAGVWVGNNDNSEMQDVSGITGAGPIWHQFMEEALANEPPQDFVRPDGLEEIEICADSGTLPSEACPRRRTERFVVGQGPLGPEHDIYQMVAIDVSTGQQATEACPPDLVERRPMEVFPPEALEWGRAHGRNLAPLETCTLHSADARVEIFDPRPESQVSGTVPIFGIVDLPDLAQFVIEYGEGPDPIGWGHVAGPFNAPVDGGMLGMWDTTGLKDMDYSLRVVATTRGGHTREARVHLWIQGGKEMQTPVAPVSPSPTSEPGWTDTPPPGPSPGPAFTPTLPPASSTPTFTPGPPATPTATPVPLIPPTSTPMPVQPTVPAETIVSIVSPADDAIVRGQVPIDGTAAGPGLVGYQLAWGAGFDPPTWHTIQESAGPVESGALGVWDTTGLDSGLYAIRLLAVGLPDSSQTVVVHVTVDNQPPIVQLSGPQPDQTLPSGSPVVVAAAAHDELGVARVEFYLDGALVAEAGVEPYRWVWEDPTSGPHRVRAVAFDIAGNAAESQEVRFIVGM